jgi:hypothetical protein
MWILSLLLFDGRAGASGLDTYLLCRGAMDWSRNPYGGVLKYLQISQIILAALCQKPSPLLIGRAQETSPPSRFDIV